jgi:hypothetical protein
VLAAGIAAPLVNALDSISGILNEATAEINGMTEKFLNDCSGEAAV